MSDLPTLILTVGLPRSGKTTWCLERWHGTGTPIVSPDAIRLALHGQRYVALAEPMVWTVAKLMVRALFLAGHPTVFVDATNTTRERRDFWRDKAWHLAFHLVDTPAAECIRRAELLDEHEIVPVIQRQALTFEPVTDEERG